MWAVSIPASVVWAEWNALHWPCNSLAEAMILLNDVVEVFDLQNLDTCASAGKLQDGVHAILARQVRAAFIDHNPVRRAAAVFLCLESMKSIITLPNYPAKFWRRNAEFAAEAKDLKLGDTTEQKAAVAEDKAEERAGALDAAERNLLDLRQLLPAQRSEKNNRLSVAKMFFR